MADFLTGCTHFGHARIIKLANRPFDSVEEMDRVLIENWNATVGDEDTVYHLGDFSYRTSPERHLQVHEQLNGRIVEVRGNHDDPHLWGRYDLMNLYRSKRKQKIVLCHYPLEEWDGWWRGSVHFHCHTHKAEFVSAERRGNVTVEACGYRPIRLEEAIERVQSGPDVVQRHPTASREQIEAMRAIEIAERMTREAGLKAAAKRLEEAMAEVGREVMTR